MTDPIQQVADQINDPSSTANLQYASLRQGVVTAINASDNSFSMNMSGDTSTVIAGVKCLTSFQPTIGDTIWCLKQNTDVIGIGKVQTGTFTAFGQAQNQVTANNVILAGNTGFFNLSSSPNSVTLTKRFSTSNLFVNMAITGWGDVAGGGFFQTAVNISGTDYIVGGVGFNAFNGAGVAARVPAVGSTVIASLPAGSVTATIRIRNVTGTGNLHVDTGDYYSLTIQEVL